MTEWKPGDRAMVKITSVGSKGYMMISDSAAVHESFVYPLPEPDPLTAAEHEFVEAWFGYNDNATVVGGPERKRWNEAITRVRATRRPPDPVERAAEALWPWVRIGFPGYDDWKWSNINKGSAAHEITMDAARAAIEAARKP